MSLEAPPTLSTAEQQEIQVLPNKDADGNNYLKVLLLSNKMTRNKWIAPFKNIGELPKEVKESFLNIPWVQKHDYEFYKRMKNIMEASGKSDDEILKELIKESQNSSSGYVDHIFDGNPNDTALYGMVKITDPVENEFINTHERPSQGFSSPGIYGSYQLDDNGNMVYNVETIRAFHQSGVLDPAFPPNEAAVKGVCKNGNSNTCKKALAFASYEPQPLENVNNSCGCNKDITMSTQQPEVKTDTTTVTVPASQPSVTVTSGTETQPLLQGASNSTQEAIEAAKKEVTRILEEDKKKQATEEQENKPQKTEAELELKRANDELKKANEEKQEMRNFFLEKMLVSTISRDLFKKDEEFNEVKEKTKGFINKYNMGLVDAEWIINTVAKGIPREETSKPKKDVGVAGFYNPDNFLKNNNTSSGSVPQSGNKSEFDDSDYPIKI